MMKKEKDKWATIKILFVVLLLGLMLSNFHIGLKEKTNVMIIESDFSTKYKYYGGSVDIQCNEELFRCTGFDYNSGECKTPYWTYKVHWLSREPNGIWIHRNGLICKITQVYQEYGWKV